MKTSSFHLPPLPHLPRRHRSVAIAHPHHHHPLAPRLARFEGVMDSLLVVGLAVLAAAMFYGIVTAVGDPRWF